MSPLFLKHGGNENPPPARASIPRKIRFLESLYRFYYWGAYFCKDPKPAYAFYLWKPGKFGLAHLGAAPHARVIYAKTGLLFFLLLRFFHWFFYWFRHVLSRVHL